MNGSRRRRGRIMFLTALVISLGCFAGSVIKTNSYNRKDHTVFFTGDDLFAPSDTKSREVYVKAEPRSNTWTKTFDPDNTGVTEHNFKALTYDFTIINNTKDEVNEFSFKLTFNTDVYLASAWNGSLEIHQFDGGRELVDTIPDLRDFKPGDYKLNMVTVDAESFVRMKAGDYLIYTPSSSVNAMEVPIEAMEATTPGIIMYVGINKDIHESVIDIRYSFNRKLTNEPLFWVSVILLGLWLLVAIVFTVTAARIRKYENLHERDNKIIDESIETFAGFIDAKDPYTHGHSTRVALYSRLIATELGYDEEEVSRVYRIALLHDCGKIGVPDHILGKPGKLTDEEFEVIKSHASRGGEILKSFKSLENADDGARYHHERYDGRGYPEGKAGEDIPFIARIICVADSFDAMTTNRVYRQKLSREVVLSELENNRGTQFDPHITDIMLRLIEEGKIEFYG